MWNSSDPYYKNKVQRSLIKTKLLTVFENKYTEDEQTAKAELWKALTTQLSQVSSLNSHTESNLNAKQGATQQEDRAYVFGRTVADSLLQCDTKDWPRLKKKIMDIFFEYEEQKLTSNRFNQTNTLQQSTAASLCRIVTKCIPVICTKSATYYS